MKKIQIVPLSKIEVLRKYLYDYLKELSNYDKSIQFNKNGTPIYKWYECYWEERTRYPIFLMVDDKIAGFALIRELNNMKYEIAEFYIVPEFRKDNNALWFATELTKLFCGEFSFSTMLANVRAVKFWNKFVLNYQHQFSDTQGQRTWFIRQRNFTTHTIGLKPIYYNLIKNNIKTLEGRLNDEKRQAYNIGDSLIIYKEPKRQENIKAIILDKTIFKNFDEMVEHTDLAQLVFENCTKEYVIGVYRNIYSKQNEEKYGVAIIKLKVIN